MRKSLEQQLSPEPLGDGEPKTEQEKRAKLISRYIKTRVISKNESLDNKEEEQIKEYYEEMSAQEKANVLYNKMMAYMIDRRVESERKKEAQEKGEEFEPIETDPYLISEIKILLNDKEVQSLLPKTYGQARLDEKEFRFSETGNLWKHLKEEIREKEKQYKDLEKKLYLKQISGRGNIASAKSRQALLADNLLRLQQLIENTEALQGFPKTPENTDIAARFQYEQLKEHQEELEQGFVWLPSRRKIHQKIINAILNGRWPALIGEAGSGKSDQVDAAAIELTGYEPTKIACSNKTGEKDLLFDKDIDPASGGSFESYKPLMQAFTGYENSLQEKPVYSGRIARLDEAYRMPHDSSGYSIIKEIRQLRPGDKFHGKKVLPGASAILTTNPPGPRYPGRYKPDAAMARELAEIEVDYPEMSVEEPEIFEFALVSLLDENGHIAVTKEELAPSYQKKDIPEEQREILDDGSIIIAKDEIIVDTADKRHGALWRFAAGVKSLQESFVYGNAETEKYPETILRYKEDADGNMEITTDGSGEPLILSNSTITLGELASWMTGFNERRQKQDIEFHTNTLTEWLNFKINSYIDQTDSADKEKLRAIFRHFGFLENTITSDVEKVKPLTPKEIGYLSPRVPRSVYLERPVVKETKKQPAAEKPQEIKQYETEDVLLEDGKRVLIRDEELVIEGETIALGERFRIDGDDFVLAGVVEDENHQNNGQPVGKFASEELYRIFETKEVDLGVLTYFKEALSGETGIDDFKQDLLDMWQDEKCEGSII